MLNVYFGDNYIFMDGKISDVSDYFDDEYEEEWLSSDMSRRIIKEIDKSEYVDGDYIRSPIFKGISPKDLSTGCKALLLIYNVPELIISGERMGDNCYPLLLEIAEEKDITITLSHIVRFEKFGSFRIRNARTGEIITTPMRVLDSLVEESKIDLDDDDDDSLDFLIGAGLISMD